MILFAFPGTGKTTLSKSNKRAIDLELSEIKYDNRSVQHLTKEERKAIRRPLSSPHYKKDYVRLAKHYHDKKFLVLVALNMLLPVLWGMRDWSDKGFHIVIPDFRLRQDYKKRYIDRGNNRRFIFEVMLVWYPTTLFFQALSLIFPHLITIMKKGEYLEEVVQRLEW